MSFPRSIQKGRDCRWNGSSRNLRYYNCFFSDIINLQVYSCTTGFNLFTDDCIHPRYRCTCTVRRDVLKEIYAALYESLGVYLPLITTNCAVLGVALNSVQYGYNILLSVVYGLGISIGFTIAIVILAGIREKMEYNDNPESWQGMPIVMVTAGLMSIAFFGFLGII